MNNVDIFVVVGENIVRGDKESIKNLLEIFDGLLEYLNEEICEEDSQNGGRPFTDYFQFFSFSHQLHRFDEAASFP